MRTKISKRVIVVIIIALAAIGVSSYQYFIADHTIYRVKDHPSGLTFMVSCRYGGTWSFHNYLTVAYETGQVISTTEIPDSVDMLSDCMKDYYRVVDIKPDVSYSCLTLSFASPERKPLRVPLYLDALYAPGEAWDPHSPWKPNALRPVTSFCADSSADSNQ